MSHHETTATRRRALAGLGTAATVGLAGCMGYTIESTDDVEQRKERIEELETEVENLESDVDDLESELQQRESEVSELNDQIEQKESRIQELESDVEDRDAEIESLQSDVETLRAEKVSSLYALGHARIEAANKSINDADSASNDEDYRLASMYWTRAEGELNGASAAFGDARTVAQEEGFTSVADTIGEAGRWTKHMSEASLDLANAYLYLSRGDESKSDEFANSAQESLDKADQYDVADPSEIDSALGL